MAKLYFRYGAMGSSKTANALMVKFNYEERGQKVILAKPETDTRDGDGIISSRIGLSSPCITVQKLIHTDFSEIMEYNAVIVDEAQFLTSKEVDALARIVDYADIPVMCYGLRTDFQGNLFEGSRHLFEVADTVDEIKTICWCGHKATYNARYNESGIVRNGSQIEIGANEKYVALCRKHFNEGKLTGTLDDFEKNIDNMCK